MTANVEDSQEVVIRSPRFFARLIVNADEEFALGLAHEILNLLETPHATG